MRVTEINLRFVKSFLIETEEGNILVDSGTPGSGEKIFPYLKDVRYVIFTHSHVDHIGGASEIMDKTNAKFGIHSNGKEYLEKGIVRKPITHSLGMKIVSAFFPLFSRGMKPARVDFTIEDNTEIVKGVRVIYTPGHTDDSITIYLEPLRSVIVGDTLQGRGSTLVYPQIYENFEEMLKSIQKILDLKPKFIYVSHGKSMESNKVAF
ncbi:MAG: MBL fold metallo-hydrolase [Sulfolobus sp.]|nr:MBL fold metallo-hydrolase [Sulfolobus sp.]